MKNEVNEDEIISTEKIIKEIENMKKNDLVLSLCSKNKVKIISIPPQVYIKKPLNDLMLLSLLILQSHQKKKPPKKVRLDDWYVQTFLLFPHRFVLSARWPIFLHSEKMNKRWIDLRAQGLVKGDAKSGFTLSKSGEKLAINLWKEIKEKLASETDQQIEIISVSKKSQFDTIVLRAFEKQPIFKEWKDETTLPLPLSMYELARILQISSTAPISKYEKRIAEYLRDGGELDIPSSKFLKARKFLLFQAIYRKEYFGDTLINIIDDVINKLNLESMAEEAEKVIISD